MNSAVFLWSVTQRSVTQQEIGTVNSAVSCGPSLSGPSVTQRSVTQRSVTQQEIGTVNSAASCGPLLSGPSLSGPSLSGR